MIDKAHLEPVAKILVPAYLETATFSRRFKDEYDEPPTVATKVHHMRSIVQVMINGNDRLDLARSFVEFGRVEFEDTTTGHSYLLRSDGAVNIERSKRQREALFDATKYLSTDVTLLVYLFHPKGLDLSVTGTRQEVGRTRLEASGPPTYVGFWPFSLDEPPTFEQGAGDPFDDLGGLDDLGKEDGR